MNINSNDVIVVEDLFNQAECDFLIKLYKQEGVHDQYINPDGLFAKQNMADRWSIYHSIYHDQRHGRQGLLGLAFDKIKDHLGDVEFFNISTYYEMYLPYDIHTDYVRKIDEPGKPHHVIILHLEDCDSRTIIFNESATYNDFYKYKERNEPLKNPTPEHEWGNYLSHCWPQDREYTSIKQIGPTWHAGTIISIDRKLFHASDNFPANNIPVKKFIQLWTSV